MSPLDLHELLQQVREGHAHLRRLKIMFLDSFKAFLTFFPSFFQAFFKLFSSFLKLLDAFKAF